jgi:hypothetical protein
MNREMESNIKAQVALAPQAITSDATTNGEWIDTAGYDSLTFLLATGALTDGDYTPVIEEADAADYSDAAAVADAGLTKTEASAAFTADGDDKATSKIGYIGSKRYVRLSVVSTGTTSGALIGALAVLGHPSHAPIA